MSTFYQLYDNSSNPHNIPLLFHIGTNGTEYKERQRTTDALKIASSIFLVLAFILLAFYACSILTPRRSCLKLWILSDHLLRMDRYVATFLFLDNALFFFHSNIATAVYVLFQKIKHTTITCKNKQKF